jgi:hypothetical protein
LAELPDAVEQVRCMHAPLIHAVVGAVRDRSCLPEVMRTLAAAEQQGWARLAGALRQILDGKRDTTLKLGLDEEDRIIVDSVLQGLDNSASLPALEQKPDGRAAAPGLASMINAAGRGDAKALAVLADMAEQMLRAGGDMARLGGVMRRLVNGERDAELLMQGMGPLGRQLLLDILSELGKAGLQ